MEVRRNSRVLAVQAIFQYFFSEQDINNIIEEFCKYRIVEKKKCDKDFFCSLVRGVCKNEDSIKESIKNCLSKKWMISRIDTTMLAIISLGIYELAYCESVPLKVVINEYVSIASLFCSDSNTGFINASLDSLAKTLRNKDVVNG